MCVCQFTFIVSPRLCLHKSFKCKDSVLNSNEKETQGNKIWHNLLAALFKIMKIGQMNIRVTLHSTR